MDRRRQSDTHLPARRSAARRESGGSSDGCASLVRPLGDERSTAKASSALPSVESDGRLARQTPVIVQVVAAPIHARFFAQLPSLDELLLRIDIVLRCSTTSLAYLRRVHGVRGRRQTNLRQPKDPSWKRGLSFHNS